MPPATRSTFDGEPCDENAPITGVGCCFAAGNAFCNFDTILIDDSCAA